MTKIDPLDPPKVDAGPAPYQSKYSSVEKFVDSRLFITVARLTMILAGSVGLPLAGWLMMRVVTAADTISTKVDDSAFELRLLKSEVKNGFDKSQSDINRQTEWLKDHEGRIRVLERTVPLSTRPN